MKAKLNYLANIFAVVVLTLAALISANVTHAAVQSSASFVTSDTVSEGNWQGKYGVDGFSIANGTQSLPAYASYTPQNALSWTWAAGTTDVRALQTTGGRLASTWYAGSSFSMNVNLADGQQHAVELYALDFDYRGRSETIQILDANSGAVLDTRSISNFSNGIYLVWNITGNVNVQVTCNGGPNAVVSGIFFGGTQASSNVAASVSFVKTDSSTQGNWQGKYGADGFSLAASASSIPSYASFSALNSQSWTWVSATSDPRALQSTYGYATAATWYNAPTFNFDVNMTDGKSHSFAMYALDWDSRGRAETVQIVDANSGAILDTRSLANFYNGVYLVWNITGHVTINVTVTAGPNAVVSGTFFAPAITAAPATNNPVSAPTPSVTGTYLLNLNSKSVSFGSVNVSSTNQQTITLTNAGTANVTVSNVTVSGAGFNASGVSTGTTLTPGQSVAMTAVFAPASTGSVTGTISIVSNATNGTQVVSLSGTGAAVSHEVTLSWSPSTSSVVGYNVYVSTVSGGNYTKLTSSPVPSSNYTDAGLQTAQTRYYVVTSIDSNNDESAYSTQVAAIVP